MSTCGSIPRKIAERRPDVILTGHGGGVEFEPARIDRWTRWMDRWQSPFTEVVQAPHPAMAMDPHWVEFRPCKVRIRPGGEVDFRLYTKNRAEEEKSCRVRYRSMAHACFRHEWLSRQELFAERCIIISVTVESMEPTLPEGCVILVDHNRRRRLKGHIFVVRKSDGLVVKRAGKDDSDKWLLVGDHPAWEPDPWRGAEVIGEVKWMAREL